MAEQGLGVEVDPPPRQAPQPRSEPEGEPGDESSSGESTADDDDDGDDASSVGSTPSEIAVEDDGSVSSHDEADGISHKWITLIKKNKLAQLIN